MCTPSGSVSTAVRPLGTLIAYTHDMLRIMLTVWTVLVGAVTVANAQDMVIVPEGCGLEASSAMDIALACEGSTPCVDALVEAECGYTGSIELWTTTEGK